VVWVLLAAEPAMVPPVASITICGSLVALKAHELTVSNTIAKNAFNLIK